MPYGPVMRCGCATKDATASWSSSGSSPSVPAHLSPPSAISTTALPLRPARRLSRWLPATAARAVRPSASAGASRSCSGGRPAEPASGPGEPVRIPSRPAEVDGNAGSAQRREEGAQRGHIGEQVAGDPERLGAADVRLAVVDEHGPGRADAQVVQCMLVDLGVRLEQVELAA